MQADRPQAVYGCASCPVLRIGHTTSYDGAGHGSDHWVLLNGAGDLGRVYSYNPITKTFIEPSPRKYLVHEPHVDTTVQSKLPDTFPKAMSSSPAAPHVDKSQQTGIAQWFASSTKRASSSSAAEDGARNVKPKPNVM